MRCWPTLLYLVAFALPKVSSNSEIVSHACDRNLTSTLPFFSRALSELNKFSFFSSSDSAVPCLLNQDKAFGHSTRKDMFTVVEPPLTEGRGEHQGARPAEVSPTEIESPLIEDSNAVRRGFQADRRDHESSNIAMPSASHLQSLLAYGNSFSFEQYDNYNESTTVRLLQESSKGNTSNQTNSSTTNAPEVQNTTTPVKIPEAQLPMDTFVAIVGGVLGFLLCCGICCALGLRKYFQDHWVYGKTHDDIQTKCCGLCYSYDDADDAKKKQKTRCFGLIKVKDHREIRNTAQQMAQKAKREKELKAHQAKLDKRNNMRKGKVDSQKTLDLGEFAEGEGEEAQESVFIEEEEDKEKKGKKEKKEKKEKEGKGKKGAPAGYPGGIPSKKMGSVKDTE